MLRNFNRIRDHGSPLLFWGAVGAAVGAIGSLIGNSQNNTANANLNYENRKWQEKQATVSYERQRQMQAAQNEYNSAPHQRKLLEQAGFNPNSMVNGGSYSTASNATAPQAGTPSTIPMQSVTPELAQIASSFALNMSQARKNNAEAKEVDSRTEGQDLQNSWQSMQNHLFSKYGEIEKQLQLNSMDSARAVSDAQRLLYRSQDQLNFNELVQMRPKQADLMVAETLANNSRAYLDRIEAAKTDEERKYISKNFALQSAIAVATISNLRAQAYQATTMGDAWSPNGVLHAGKRIENMRSSLDYEQYSRIYDETIDSYVESLKNANMVSSDKNERRIVKDWSDVSNWMHNLKATLYYQQLDELGTVLGGTGAAAVNAVTRGPLK